MQKEKKERDRSHPISTHAGQNSDTFPEMTYWEIHTIWLKTLEMFLVPQTLVTATELIRT